MNNGSTMATDSSPFSSLLCVTLYKLNRFDFVISGVIRCRFVMTESCSYIYVFSQPCLDVSNRAVFEQHRFIVFQQVERRG